MREIVFRVTAEQPGRIRAIVQDRGLVVEAPSLEELHHEAREALIRQVGPAHGTYRIRIRRDGLAQPTPAGDSSAQRHPSRQGQLMAGSMACLSRADGPGRPSRWGFPGP